MNTNNKKILDIPVSALNYDQVTNQIIDWCKNRENRTVGVCNVHSVTSSFWTEDLKQSLLSTDTNTADGMPLVWALKLLGKKNATRVYGPTLMLYLLAHARHEKLRVAFYGGHSDRLETLVDRMCERFVGLNVVEAISPPFRALTSEEENEHVRRLQDARPHLIFVGIGCPKQEMWMARNKTRLPAVQVGVGAAFDFHAGAVPQAPYQLQKLGLEWAYRLYCEPQRLFKRYLTTNPVFLVKFAIQLVGETFSKWFSGGLVSVRKHA